ncbi:MAG: trehalose-phosphatase, partial [Bacteroidota bacterium]
KRYNIHHWVELFVERLSESQQKNNDRLAKQFEEKTLENLKQDYQSSKERMLFLDYDGTLVGFFDDPNDSHPDAELIQILEKLAEDPNNRVVVISGRGRDTLGKWLGDLNIDLICEHGVWLREKGGDWEMIKQLDDQWKRDILPVLDLYVNRTPGSFIEEKNYSLVWHYRKVETGLGELRTRELSSHIKYLTNNMPLQVLEGDMVVEIKDVDVSKGKATTKWLGRFPHDFTMAIGDDTTDEYTFKAVPDEAYTIKVGQEVSAAKYYVSSHKEVRKLLKELAGIK